jgi:anaerobic magnesium-protoporphyrin IX monomethyl ester cyclase
MNILLIYPRFKSNGYFQIPPLGILYIASILRKYGHHIAFADMTFMKSYDNLKEHTLSADLIGISVPTSLAGTAYDIIKYIRNMRKDILIVGGGPHATIQPIDMLNNGFNIVTIAESEKTILHILEIVQNKGVKIDGIAGIAYKKLGKTIVTKTQKRVKVMDAIPFPAIDLINWELYSLKGYDMVPVIVSRGCPFNCRFCQPVQKRMFGTIQRRRSVQNVIQEINMAVKAGMTNFIFLDDCFTYNKRWIDYFCTEIIQKNIVISWQCQSRADAAAINVDSLKKMKEAGCRQINFGVESGSQKILDFLNKRLRVDEIIKAFRTCQDVGIKTHAFILIGSPMETRKDLAKTMDLVQKIKPDSVFISRLTPAKGTFLYPFAVKHGIYNICSYEENDYYQNKFPLKLKHINERDMDIFEWKLKRSIFFLKIKRLLTSFNSIKDLIKCAVKWIHLRIKYISIGR